MSVKPTELHPMDKPLKPGQFVGYERDVEIADGELEAIMKKLDDKDAAKQKEKAATK